MSIWAAIVLTLLLLTASVVVEAGTGLPLTVFMVLGTALWAAVDSNRIGLRRYKSGVALGPIALFFGIALLWIVGFPWYVTVRGRIKRGAAQLKEEFRTADDADTSHAG
jgi:hypothetical protein